MSVSVKEASGVVVIDQIHSLAIATHICSRCRIDSRAAKIVRLSGTDGYQVALPGLAIAEVKRILNELRIEVQMSNALLVKTFRGWP